MRLKNYLIIFLLLSAALLTACGEEPAAPAEPTAPPATATMLPAAPSATAVAAAPTSTPLPAPVIEANTPEAATTVPSATAAPPTATPPIPGVIGGAEIPAGTNPLTGETVADPSVLDRRPVAVKISNYPALVRPQSGLNDADLVFEHYAEGGVTRFTALFYGRGADTIGSIRSGRLIDLEIPRMYDAAFAYSGSSGPVREFIRDGVFFDRVISPDFGHGGFYRVEGADRPLEHTLFTDTATLWYILDQRGLNAPPQYEQTMTFSDAVINPASTASSLEIRYRGTNAFWQYSGATGRYLRWTDGVPHLDANSGLQLSFRNVVVLGAHHEDTDILEDFVGGGSYSIQIQVWGEGPVSIFRDGQRIDGRWVRQEPDQMLTFHDLDGFPLPLAPGNTFFQLVPLGFDGLVTTP